MSRKNETFLYNIVSDNMSLMNKIYQSFEALEEALGTLKMEEPLFMTYAAKKSFAKSFLKAPEHHEIRH